MEYFFYINIGTLLYTVLLYIFRNPLIYFCCVEKKLPSSFFSASSSSILHPSLTNYKAATSWFANEISSSIEILAEDVKSDLVFCFSLACMKLPWLSIKASTKASWFAMFLYNFQFLLSKSANKLDASGVFHL